MRTALLFAVAAVLLLAAPVVASSTFCDLGTLDEDANGAACGRVTPAPTVRAHALGDETIEVDGVLDDPAWEKADAAWGFRVWDPTRGELPSQETVFKVAYDDEAVYFGVACYEDDPSVIRAPLCRRDSFHDSDIVSLYVDTYHDHTTGYNFRVNAAGVQGDRYVYNDGNMDRDWNTVWQVEVSRDGEGWYAEFRIPFSCVRYEQTGDMTWGCNLYRYMHALGEDTAWTIWDTETRGFVSRFGEITGLVDVPAARQLELMPYVVGTVTDTAGPGSPDDDHYYGNFGLDLKYGVTSNFTLNAAFQPDFGQVEADPALLNLSPFETYYQEKRPFFIEGNRFFEHPDFNVFYSRRIGTGGENARIRAAAKLTGKTASGFSMAALYAATDVTEPGKAHQPFTSGERPEHHFAARFGKEFSEGAHRINFMQTGVFRSADRDVFGDYASRDAWTSAADFDLNFHDRDYNVRGSFVGSTVDPAPYESDPDVGHSTIHGTGGRLALRKVGGAFIGGVSGRWETDRLDLNDAGFLSAADEMNVGGWIRYEHNADDSEALIVRGHVGLDFARNALYAGRTGYDRDTGEEVWSYEKGHPTGIYVGLNSSAQLRNYWHVWCGGGAEPSSTSKYATRGYEDYDGEYVQGPLMSYPASFWGWLGLGTDHRKAIAGNVDLNAGGNERGAWNRRVEVGVDWTATDAMTYSVSVAYRNSHSEAQHLDNFENPGGGIGGVSYVFAEMEQQTVDATFRADILFSRNLSLQLYAQPYLTAGTYGNPRELVTPDSYDLETPTDIPDFSPSDVHDYDFTYAAVNINAVLRWEYVPGSTAYLVWKQGRGAYDDRFEHPGLDPSLDFDELFGDEPENVFLAKVSYWFSL